MITFTNHAFRGLDSALESLFTLLETMGGHVDALLEILPRGLDVANPQDFLDAKQIDKNINEAELQADKLVADIIHKFTISGEDLRFILAAVKTAGTLERAADKIKNCIKRLPKIQHPLDGMIHVELGRASAAVRRMFGVCLKQIVDYQEPVSQQLLADGAEVQGAYRNILIHLHQTIVQEHPASDSTHLLLMAKNLEQAADMAIEIMKIGHYVNFGTKYEKNKAE